MSEPMLILFEDAAAGRFEPVALTRAVARLRAGVWTHRERWTRLFPERRAGTVVRGHVRDVERACGEWDHVNEAPAGDALFVAAAAGRQAAHVDTIRSLGEGEALVAAGVLLAFRTGGDGTPRAVDALLEWIGDEPMPAGDADGERFAKDAGLRVRAADAIVPRTLVDLMVRNADTIAEDFAAYEPLMPPPDGHDLPGVHLVEPDRIRLGAGVRLAPGVVLDASEGPILLGPGTRVQANAVILGPVALGADCLVRPLSRVMDGTSAGPVCKLGGEVDATIVLGHSNKQHDGFLGHSYLGSWVNLGAATDTSDLKNDYGPVAVSIAGESIATGTRGVGSLIGDHTKTGIHTVLNTGTVLGVSCNLFGPGLPPKAVPSFTWGGAGAWREYRIDKALSVARIVTARRNVVFGAADQAALRRVHAAAAA
ncbi:hypothetical protein K8I85_16900, partial [bacterium]|nr:hypothetical protein [bacterium]